MPTRKFYLEFRENPQIGDSFSWRFRDELGQIEYENEENLLTMNWGAGNVMPFQTAVGATLAESLTNLLSQLNMGWLANYTNLFNRTTNISYAIEGNALEITVVYEFKNLIQNIFTNERCFLRTDSPCENYVYQNTSPVFDFFGQLENPNFLNNQQITLLKNVTLNQNIVIGTTPYYDCVFRRNDTYQINFLTPVSVFFFRVYASQNFIPYFESNTLFIPIIPDPLLPENAFEFSIDGINWQNENSFTELDEGIYTLRVRDSIGCLKTYEIENTGQSNVPTVPDNIFISESNSIRFSKREEGFKNVLNTLSCEEFQGSPVYQWIHKFSNTDVVKTQIKSSFQDLEASHGTIEKLVANIGITDIRDAIIFTNNELQLALRFESGNIYAPNGTDIIGTYELNGNFPDWGVIGNFVNTEFGIYEIIDIKDNSLILFDNSTALTAQNTIVSVTYNREIYDIFEHTIDMSEYQDSCFQINISDKYLSEMICTGENLSDFLFLKWKNSKNTDVYFATGIEFFGWFENFTLSQNSDGEVESLKTDSKVFTIQNLNYQTSTLKINALTTGLVRKLSLALKHDFLEVNGLLYKLIENPEIERFGNSNLYSISAKITESADPFDSIGTQNLFNGDVVRLLENENEKYIKI